MIDINLYRCRIGKFSPNLRNKKSSFINKLDRSNQNRTGENVLSFFQALFKALLLVTLLSSWSYHHSVIRTHSHTAGKIHGHAGPLQDGPGHDQLGHPALFVGRKLTTNFKARYTNGNKQNKKGIKNLHLNIRSLSNKVCEIKTIVKEQTPNIFGISECELRKVNGKFDEEKLKVPGYDLLFPKSWKIHGFARVVVYVKKNFQYQQVHDLEDDLIQSVWLKGSFKNSKSIYFCHCYREHTSRLGTGISQQRQYLDMFLAQWEEAATHSNPNEPNEVHVSGDMNIDALEGRWLKPEYHLVTLARLVQTACNLGNFTQLVNVPTRFQYNSVKKTTDFSCIDHVYTNCKFRCSSVSVIPFGGSDHDAVGYTRFSKPPPSPARTIRKRSYKNFVQADFICDLSKVDWLEVYQCQDVDTAAEVFTRKFVEVFNHHAPWIIYQQRKNFKPWVTEETKKLIESRNKLKKAAAELATSGEDQAATEAWIAFKKVRNKINNRRKYEEKNFKSEKIKNSLDSPSNTWNAAKNFMEWENSGGPPHQLSIGNKLITKAGLIATEINKFFINKVKLIRDGIMYLPNSFTKCKEIMEGKNCKLGLGHVTLSKVNKLLKNLKNSKSTSIDELDNFCVKIAADEIDRPLHHIITLSILQHKFPRSWKYSKVIPLHKKHSKLEMKNYRPVAILSPLSKILEKVVYEQLYEYMTRNNIFHPNLHGYRQHRSTQTALMTMYDRWVKAAEVV